MSKPALSSRGRRQRLRNRILLGAILSPLVGYSLFTVSLSSTSAAAEIAVSPDDTSEVPEVVARGTLPIEGIEAGAPSARSAAPAAAVADPSVGETRNWLALDNVAGFYYRKEFTLRAVLPNIEVWVATEANRRGATGLQFPDGDCRNDGVRTEVTVAQALAMANEFQNNMLPKESAVFSVAPPRDGTNPLVPVPLYNPLGDGNRTVVLVDNVRDTNFYNTNNASNFTFIAGFFSSQLNAFFDRNVMTIDGWDWVHRTGANPPNEPVPGDLCKSAPARPFGYEGVFAHEYQHLLESYADSDESTWVNEGLSDWAEVLTGYVNVATPVTEIGFESHTQCFLGFLGVQTPANPTPRPRSGPENSLTRWEDQGDAEILCDYGAAMTFMNYVHGRFGDGFMTALHNGAPNGLAAIDAALQIVRPGTKETALDLVHKWSVMVAVDGWLDAGGRLDAPYPRNELQTPALNASINWDTPEAYSSPGAPSNGSDYVRLRDGAGNYVTGKDIDAIAFAGASTLPPQPLAWTSTVAPPASAAAPALYSGTGDNRDESMTRVVSVPAGAGATLMFDAAWNLEDLFDYALVQVSTDGGATYSQGLACTGTTTAAAPDVDPATVAALPGFNGTSAVFVPSTCDLSPFAGRDVVLSFRTINDPAAQGNTPALPPGFYVRNIRVGAARVGDDTTAGWKSKTEQRPISVTGFTVHLVSARIDEDRSGKRSENAPGKVKPARLTITKVPLTEDFMIAGKAKVNKLIEPNADFVAAIVTYDDPTETIRQYAPYRLVINGVTQPGGGT